VITQVSNQFVVVGQEIVISNSTVANTLPVIYSLGGTVPADAAITTNGVFTWLTTCAQGSTINPITVWVTDSSSPPLSNFMTFSVTVGACVQLVLGSTVLPVGQSGGIPVALSTTGGLTNLSFTLALPGNRLTNWTITPSNAAIATATVQAAGSSPPMFNFVSQSGQSLQNSSVLGTIGFTALAGDSAFLPVSATSLSAIQTNSASVANPFSQPGQIVVVGLHPLLALLPNPNSTFAIALYGNIGSNYQMAFTTNLASTNWQTVSNILMTNLQQSVNVNPTNAQMFFRLQ
jgi:hypothetical protein